MILPYDGNIDFFVPSDCIDQLIFLDQMYIVVWCVQYLCKWIQSDLLQWTLTMQTYLVRRWIPPNWHTKWMRNKKFPHFWPFCHSRQNCVTKKKLHRTLSQTYMPMMAVEVVKLVSMWFYFYSRSLIGDSIRCAYLNWLSRTRVYVVLLLFDSLFVLQRSCGETKTHYLHMWRVQRGGRNSRRNTEKRHRSCV